MNSPAVSPLDAPPPLAPGVAEDVPATFSRERSRDLIEALRDLPAHQLHPVVEEVLTEIIHLLTRP